VVILCIGDSIAQCPGVTPSFVPSQTNICGPGATTINFTNTSTGANAATASYEWFELGVPFDTIVGLGAPGSASISAAGTYNYMMIATDGGCEDTAFQSVVIHPIPVADFSFAPDSVCAGTTINFTNLSTGTNSFTTYSWNFGDGNTSAATNPSNVYAFGGSYNVTLTVTNFVGCSDTYNATVFAMDIPIVAIGGNDGDGNTVNCLTAADTSTSETVWFYNFTTGGVSYTWDFGDGSSPVVVSTTDSISHSYSVFGPYTVTMTATHANGCTATATLLVVFEKFAAASFTIPVGEYGGCVPHTVNPTNMSVNATTYTWDFGDGTVITTTSPIAPSHTYTTAGSYSITLTASNNCNSPTNIVGTIEVIAGPTASFTTSLPSNLGCDPETVFFTNTSTDMFPSNNFYWDMGNGNTYTNIVNPPPQTYTQGVYTVMLVAGSGCGPDTTYQTIIIDVPPTAIIDANPFLGCSPLTVHTDNFSVGGSLNYAWYIDGVLTYTTDTIPDQTFTAPYGNVAVTHTIMLQVSNQCGTDDTTATIEVHPPVIANFNPPADTICEGGSITFTDVSSGDSLTWAWDFGNGNTASVQGPHTETYLLAGTYSVELIVNGYCGIDTIIQPLVVTPKPVIAFTPDTTQGCEDLTVSWTNTSTLGGTYFWNFGPTVSPDTSNLYTPASTTFPDTGTHIVTLVVNVNGCADSDSVAIIVFPMPTAGFTATPNDGCSPLDVAFTVTS